MGWLDSVSADGVAYGWTCDPNDFGAALQVHFYVDGAAGWGGTYIGQTTANGWREQGVADACGGNPYHGFAWRMPDSVRNGQSRTLYAYAINIGPAAGNPLLDGSPKWFTLQPPPPPDSDGDGRSDPYDNCRWHWNADQADTDVDGIGDTCDSYNNNGHVVEGLPQQEAWDYAWKYGCPSGSTSAKRFTARVVGKDLTRRRHLTTTEFTGIICVGGGIIRGWRDMSCKSTKSSWPFQPRGAETGYPRGFGVWTSSGRAECRVVYDVCVFDHGCYDTDVVWITVYSNGQGYWYYRLGQV
jgi:hypothetical protein